MVGFLNIAATNEQMFLSELDKLHYHINICASVSRVVDTDILIQMTKKG